MAEMFEYIKSIPSVDIDVIRESRPNSGLDAKWDRLTASRVG